MIDAPTELRNVQQVVERTEGGEGRQRLHTHPLTACDAHEHVQQMDQLSCIMLS